MSGVGVVLWCAWVLWAGSVAVDAYDSERDCWKGVEVRERPLNGQRPAIQYTCWPVGHRP